MTAASILPAAGQRGAVLLVALILAATVAVLSLQLLADTELTVRSLAAGERQAQAEWAAQSGVEWALARIAAGGETAVTAVVPIAADTEARVQVVPGGNPNVIAEGRAGGAAVTVRANAVRVPKPFPYRFACFAGTSSFVRPTTLEGPAYFAEPSQPISTVGSGTGATLLVNGNVDLRTATAPPAGYISHTAGQTRVGQAGLPPPVWNTAAFLGLTSGAVLVHRYSGSPWIKNRTLDGIVLVEVGFNDGLTLENTVINGTVVIHAPYTANPMPKPANNWLWFRGNVTINGGTAWTGNLAVLAPDCEVGFQTSPNVSLHGVTYVGRFTKTDGLQATGMVLTRADFNGTNQFRLSVPPGWTPQLPLGLTLPDVIGWQVEWLGRQP